MENYITKESIYMNGADINKLIIDGIVSAYKQDRLPREF